MEEKELICQAKSGDVFAFEQLVHRYDKKVLGLALQMVNDIEEAKDIYQEVFLKVFRCLEGFRAESSFSSWLYRIVVNTCINYCRQHQRRSQVSPWATMTGKEREIVSFPDIDAKTPEEVLLRKEMTQQIRKLADGLPPKQKMVFLLRYYGGFSLQQIADTMRISEGAVKNYLFRTHEKMRKGLRQYFR